MQRPFSILYDHIVDKNIIPGLKIGGPIVDLLPKGGGQPDNNVPRLKQTNPSGRVKVSGCIKSRSSSLPLIESLTRTCSKFCCKISCVVVHQP